MTLIEKLTENEPLNNGERILLIELVRQIQHPDYTPLDGRQRPFDLNHDVMGDTRCICNGIAWYHAPFEGCDDCPCVRFEAVQ